MAEANTIFVKMEVDQEKVDRLSKAEEDFRVAAKALEEASKELRSAMMDLRDPFILVRTSGKE